MSNPNPGSVFDLPLNLMRDAAELAVTVAVASEAGLFDALAGEPADAAELARRTGLSARGVAIVLPVVAEMGYVRAEEGAYALTEQGRRQLVERGPDNVAGGLRLWLENLRAWTRLGEALRTGEPLMDGGTARSDEALARYMAGMAATPAERVRRVVELCLARRPGARRVLDLGGGPGLYSRAFVEAGLEATLLDTPETVAYVRQAYGLDEVRGLRLVTGDFRAGPLPSGPYDLVLASNVTHIYAPDANRAILARAHEVLAPGGVVAVADFVRGKSPRAARFAVVMLLRTEGGDTYDAAAYRGWLEEAGFADVRIDDIDAERQLVTAAMPAE